MGPLMVSFSYYSHTISKRIPKGMGMVWEAYHKGSHYWWSLKIPLTLSPKLHQVDAEVRHNFTDLRDFVLGMLFRHPTKPQSQKGAFVWSCGHSFCRVRESFKVGIEETSG